MASLLSRLETLEATYKVSDSHNWLYITMVTDADEEGTISVVYDIGTKSSLRKENTDNLPNREFIQLCEDEWGVEMMDDYYSNNEMIRWKRDIR